MEFFRQKTNIAFLSQRKLALVISSILLLLSVASLSVRGLNFGIDFSGGTLVEVGYQQPVEIESVRDALQQGGLSDAVVQHFGTAKDVLVRLPTTLAVAGESGAESDTESSQDSGQESSQESAQESNLETGTAAQISERVIRVLRAPYHEVLVDIDNPGELQQCVTDGATAECRVQMRRVEFVGPQVGDELANQGGLAMLYALIGILIYVTFRFEWRFAVGSVVALVHDVLITIGVFSLFQFDFSLPVLAAVLAVIGYSLNDTIVVYDRIRENFRKMRKRSAIEIIDQSINQTLPRTVLTSLTTLVVVLTLLIFGGEVIRGFSIALLIGVVIGTYSSIFVASPAVLALGITREDLLVVQKEGADSEP